MRNTPKLLLVLLTLLSIALSGNPASAQSEAADLPYVWLIEAESLFGYSDQAGGADDTSTSNDWITSLSYRLNENDRLIGAYNGSFQKSRLFISQDEGSRESNQLMTHNATAAYLKQINENWSLRPTGYYNVVFVKETADEDLGKGLYDFEDIGGGIESTHQLEATEAGDRSVYASFNYFHRQYPHFSSLLSLFDPNLTTEVNEKDFDGYKIDAGMQAAIAPGLSGNVDAMCMWKDFTDKRTIDANGIRQGSNREDFYFEVLGSLNYRLNESVSLGLSSGFRQNLSNLDLYDARGTVILTDDRFIEDYYDYIRYNVSPSVTLRLMKIDEAQKSVRIKFGYDFDSTYYPGRNALDARNELKEDEQQDDLGTIFARLDFPITQALTWVSSAKYEKQTSNQEFEETYVYNYEVWSVLSGIKFEY